MTNCCWKTRRDWIIVVDPILSASDTTTRNCDIDVLFDRDIRLNGLVHIDDRALLVHAESSQEGSVFYRVSPT